MKYLLLTLLLTGCAGMPPQWLASYYNGQDTCQLRNLKPGERQPSYCGGSRGNTTTYIRQTTPTRYEVTK